MSAIGENIKKRREELGISQVDLAELIGESKQTIWKYESGTVTNIPLCKVELIANVLHCLPQDIAGWNNSTKTQKNVLKSTNLPDNLQRLADIWDRISEDEMQYILFIIDKHEKEKVATSSRSVS